MCFGHSKPLFSQVHTLSLLDESVAIITDFSWKERVGDGYATVALSVVMCRVDYEPAHLKFLELTMAPNVSRCDLYGFGLPQVTITFVLAALPSASSTSYRIPIENDGTDPLC